MDWQQAAYISTTIGMIVITAVGLLCLWMLYNLTRFAKHLTNMVDEGSRLIEDSSLSAERNKVGLFEVFIKNF